jgi:hypothetical protein
MNRMTANAGLLTALPVIAIFGGTPALAHHSFAMFDREHTLTMKGTVKAWEFTNPHSYLQVVFPDAQGKGPAKEWSLETISVNQLVRKGFRQSTFQPGDTVTVVFHPLKSGAPGGELVRTTASADNSVREFSP